VVLALALLAALNSASATAAGLEDEGGAEWRLERVLAPELPSGVRPTTPIGLGALGDLEFWAPNRGLLITPGNGSTISPGLWAYNGIQWHELSAVCGATDGRITWAGPDEFWTVSDGRPGQAPDAHGNLPPLADNTLCHFKNGAVITSYASPAFRASSYQRMQAAACISPLDCWFAGDALPEPQVGAFHLHWNGRTGTLEAAPYLGEAHAVEDMRAFDGGLYESLRLSSNDAALEHLAEPPALHLINPLGISPTFEALSGLPLYGANEFPEALDALRLSADGNSLWAAAGPRGETPEGSEPARVTVARYTPGLGWNQILGPQSSGPDPFAGEVVRSIAADPQTEAAWIALAASSESGRDPTARAVVARIDAQGTVTDEQTLPSAQETAEGVGPKGAAARISCPAPHDCWLATTAGWLFHLSASPPGTPPPEGVDSDPSFAGVITSRPPDEGLPQVAPDVPPPDDSGLLGPPPPPQPEVPPSTQPRRVTVALVSKVRVRLVRGTTLELRFHLAVRARVRLVATRRRATVAATSPHTLAAGAHSLLLALDRRRWPTKLDLRAHPLAALPTVVAGGGSEHPFTTGATLALPKTSARWELLG
jgi:hypothetical protein